MWVIGESTARLQSQLVQTPILKISLHGHGAASSTVYYVELTRSANFITVLVP